MITEPQFEERFMVTLRDVTGFFDNLLHHLPQFIILSYDGFSLRRDCYRFVYVTSTSKLPYVDIPIDTFEKALEKITKTTVFKVVPNGRPNKASAEKGFRSAFSLKHPFKELYVVDILGKIAWVYSPSVAKRWDDPAKLLAWAHQRGYPTDLDERMYPSFNRER